MRYLTLLLFPFLLFACTERETTRIAAAETDYIVGTFAGEHFRVASINGYEATTFYVFDSADRPLLPYAFVDTPDYYPETGLYVGRTTELSEGIVEFIIADNTLHENSFPATFTNVTLVKSDLISEVTSCPHPDGATSVILAVNATINKWEEDYMEGTFVDPTDPTTAGEFRFFIPYPGL